MNHAIDLRKSNLFLDAANSAVNLLINQFKGIFSTSIEKSSSKQKAQIQCDEKSYYECAPKRNAKPVSIQRELTASGNSW